MMKIVSFKICPFVQRVTAALETRSIPYEIEYINLSDKPEWFLDLAPNGQVPVLITESGRALFESDAIIEYIEDEYGAVEANVTNEQRALDRAWAYLGAKNYMPQCGTMSSKDKATFEERTAKFVKAFSKVEAQLSGDTAFFKSDSISNVDIAWLPLLHRIAIVKKHTDFDFLCGLPKVQAWQTELLSSGLVEKTVSTDFEALFADFYLTNTFLGQGEDVQQSSVCGASNCCG